MRFLERLNEWLADKAERMEAPLVQLNEGPLESPLLACDTPNVD